MSDQPMCRRSLLSALLTMLFIAGTAVQAQQIQVSAGNRTVSVAATAEAERRADTALIHVGYQLYAASSTQVSEQAGAASKAIVSAILRTGVKDDAIESVSQGTGPVQAYQANQFSPEERAERKFGEAQEWTVRATPESASLVLASAVDAGANQSGGIDWSVADEASLSAEAASKALQRARAVAEQMAAGLGAKLGVLLYASNEAQQVRVLPMTARAAPVMISDGPSIEMKRLDLSAPRIHRSATVSAVFAIQ